MSAFRTVTPRFSVAPQITPAALSEAAAEGFTAVICNRPDHEEPGQPSAQAMQAAAQAAGLTFTHIPVAGGFPPAAVAAMGEALGAAGDGKVLAWCRSGTRSVTLWALAGAAGGADPHSVIAAAAGAGYDLSGLEPTLQGLAGR
jgi:uncharacterized protein (TIGR01244 family)